LRARQLGYALEYLEHRISCKNALLNEHNIDKAFAQYTAQFAF